MNEIIIKMLLDITVAALLCATIFYCKKLNIRIKLLQDSKSELAQLIKQFDASTKAAVDNIQDIHKASRKISDNIQAKLDKANYLANDLEFMIERADKTANKIERTIKGERNNETIATTKNQDISTIKKASLDEKISQNKSPAKASDKRGLEAMMDRISELKTNKNDTTKDTSNNAVMRPMARMRSKTEQDLMQALKKSK